jgi:alpha-tubulin suppressor-like RCC1 family protein
VIVDVAGWFAQDGAYSALSPSRLMDSRSGEATIDNRFARQGLINSGQIYHLQVLGRGGVPATGVSAVAVNVTVTGPTNPSFLSVFPKGEAIPNASNLNFVPGQTIPNMVIAKVGADGSISIRNGSGAVHVIVDIAGWYASPTETVTEALPQNTVRPTLSGNLAPGFVITANPGTWTGSPTPTYTYNWLRCTSQVNTSSVSTPANCLTILGQTGPTYTLTFDDANRFVVAEVSGTNSAGSTSFWTSSTALVAQQSNLNLVLAPVRSGNGSQGSVLSVTSGQWFGEPSITYSWMRCDSRVGSLSVTEPTGCVTIADQTSSAYTISQADAGRFVLAKVTATNLTGSLSVWTSSTQTSNPANTVDPTISGSATNLSTLTANVGTWQGFPIPTYTYQWFRCDSEVASASDSVSADCLAISGATASTLVLSALDVGKHLMLRVAAANSLGSVIRFSASTDNVTTPPLVSTTPTVSGARDTGQVLTVSNGTWIASPVEMETSHHWFRCTSSVSATTSTLPSQCSEISGATSATYTQTPDDVGRFITVRTSRTNIIGTTNLWSVVSEATVVSVQNVSDPTVSGVAALGASISVDPGTWVGSPSFAYLWFSCANAVDSPSDSLADHCIQVPEITSVTSGKSHACARALSGHLQCWGTTGYGKLGRGGNSGSGEIPALVLGPSSYRSVSAGNDHTCAVLASGVVQCWGSNEFGQLGSNGTMSNQVQIQSPMNVLGLTNATAVSAGGGHTCALLSGGSLACWGKNSSGQLGNGGSLNRATPLQVGGVSSAVSLSSGSSHTCAVLANGTVQCWGNNGSGRLGDGTGTNRLVPTSVSGITTAISVSAGAEHTCAVLANGTIQCWGNNSSGRLGDGTVTNRLVPTSVSGITTAISVSAGGTGTCYVSQNGSVECWGSLDGREFILKGQSVLLPRTYMSVIPIRTSRQITLESSQDEETGRYLVARVTATNSSGSIVRFTKSTQAVQN